MSILSKVTLGFVSVAALLMWYMAMRTLKTHQAWRSAVQAHQTALENTEKKVTEMIEGNAEQGTLSLGQLQVALDDALFGRGRAWMDCSPRYDAATGTVIVTVNLPQPHQITPNTLLHAFQGLDDPAGGQYMGEFNVTAADATTITLQPSYRPTQARQAQLQQARGPWALYAVLPSDTNDLFAGLGEQEILDLLPERPRQQQGETNDEFQARLLAHDRLVQEYLQDNKPIDPDNPPPPERTQVVIEFIKDQSALDENTKAELRNIDFGENLVKERAVMQVDLPTATKLVELQLAREVERRYQRKLRDYSYILRDFHRELPVLEDRIVNLERDRDYMIEANKVADADLKKTKDELVALQAELDLTSKERDTVSQFRDTLQERLDKVNAEIARLMEENQRLATQLAQRQLQAVQPAARPAAATALATPR